MTHALDRPEVTTLSEPDADPPLLDVRGLGVIFKTPVGTVQVVEDVSFAIGRGERIAVVGESGSGKSVTAMAIIGLVPQPAGSVNAGEVRFDGQDLLKLDRRQMRHLRGARIGMVFQDAMTSLNPLLSIGRHITEPLVYHKGMSEAAARKRAVELLDLVRIPYAADNLGK